MIFFWKPATLVSKISSWLTLEPWDIILTGAPPLQCDLIYFEDGDSCFVEVEGFPQLASSFKQVSKLSCKAKPKYKGKYFPGTLKRVNPSLKIHQLTKELVDSSYNY